MYEFDNGCTVTLRTSGTEPKIKFYTEIAGTPGMSRASVSESLIVFVEALVAEMIQPKLHNLARP
jgi:phosphomannomutase